MPLDKEFYDEVRAGKRDLARTAGVAVTQVTGRLSNPDPNIYQMVMNPETREMQEKAVAKKTPEAL